MEKERSESDVMIEKMFFEHGDSLLRMCCLYLNDWGRAEDALQETFLKAYLKYGSFRNEASLKTWLTRIAVNTCKNMLRSRRDFSEVPVDWPGEQGTEQVAERLSVCEEIGRLPLPYREVILLRYYQEMDQKSIASLLRIPQTTVAYRIRQGKKLLSKGLKEVYFDEQNERRD